MSAEGHTGDGGPAYRPPSGEEVGRYYETILLEPVIRLEPLSPVCVAPDVSIADAVTRANAIHAGSVLVTDHGALVGILTERDLLRRVVDRVPLDHPVQDVMTLDPTVVRLSDSILATLRLMQGGAFRHMPVVDDAGRLSGILSVKDILRLIVSLTPEATVLRMEKGAGATIYEGFQRAFGFAAFERAIDYFAAILARPTDALDPHVPITVPPDTALRAAIGVMNEARTGSVMITTSDGALAGIFTERDLMRRVLGKVSDLATPLEAVMTVNPTTVRREDSIGHTLFKLFAGGHRHMPVVGAQGDLSGIISVRDFMRFLVGLTRND